MVSCMPTKQRKEDIFHSITLLDFLQKINIHLLKVGHKCCLGRTKKKKKKRKNTLVSGNAGDQRNAHPGDRKFISFNQFSGDVLFSSLISFAFLCSCFFVVCLFFEMKNIYVEK